MERLQFGFLLLFVAAAHAATPTASDAPIVMSSYEVRASSVDFKRWIKLGSPHYVLYTDASASRASQALREFEMLHYAGQVVFGRKSAELGRTLAILPTARSDWRKIEPTGAGIEWASAAALAGGHVTELLVVHNDWEEEGLSVARAALALSDMPRMDITGPFWFQRGFGKFYETADFDGDKVVLGYANPIIAELKERRWLPWGRFFEVTATSPEFTKESRVAAYEAQAALFTQFLFANSDRVWIDRLVAWLDYLRAGGAPTEAQFKAIFGQDWKTWQATMEKYLAAGRHSLFTVTVPPAFSHYTETPFQLPAREMRELFVLTQIVMQRGHDSEVSLDRLLAGGLESESLRELLTEACLTCRRRDAALQNVRQLIAAGSTNPRVYRGGDALLTADAGDFRLDLRYGPEWAQAVAWDRRGLELEPRYTDLNESLAINEACAPEVDQQTVTTIEACYTRMRGRAPTDDVMTALALALWRVGETKTAGELAEHLQRDPLVAPRYRDLAGQLLERIRTNTAPSR